MTPLVYFYCPYVSAKTSVITLALALLLSIMMVLASVPAMAAAPTNGSITVNSPIIGATYNAYKIFDMTTNEAKDAFSYSIKSDSPFYDAVNTYAAMPASGTDANADGLTLTVTADTKDETVKEYVVTVSDKFDAQAFGQAMLTALNGLKEAGTNLSAYTASPITVTTANADKITFENLDLGYFLINPTYPKASAVEVTMGEDANKKTFTVDDLVKEDDKIKKPAELTAEAKTKIEDYVTATVTDAYVNKYITDHNITANKDGKPLDDTGKGEYRAELIASMKADAENRVIAALTNNGSEADINVKEPILVFLDSSQPDAVINEKNEITKWDIPVNPDGIAEPGTPDHGEPEGGKNIIVQEATATTPAIYADWTEANIGDSIHYQLRVNAMNFIQNAENPSQVPDQVKEYFLADYQSGHMHFDESKGLHVSVWQGDNANDSQASTKANVTKKADGTTPEEGYLDYTNKVDTFFKNTSNNDAATKPTDIFGDGTGIMVPWVKVVGPVAADYTPDTNFPIYTITNVPKVNASGNPVYKTEEFKMENDARVPAKTSSGTVITGQYVSVNGNIINGEGQLLDANNNPIQDSDTYYVYSLYNSDVTIVVDYWMILDDDAIVDEPGNKNYAQYGYSTVDNKDQSGKPKKPENPSDEDKPDQKKEVDEATVYTYAIAWVKVDNKANSLAGAKFELPFYVKTTKDGNAYVYGGTEAGDDLTKEVTTDETGVITIKGLKAGTYSITETEAPEGYNVLTAPFEVQAKKSGEGVTTKTETTIYLDAQGNITDTVTSTTVTKTTDTDSFNNASATGNEEKSVPVYQFNPIENKKGTELPATGGVGTTIFYVAGSILVLAAAILLITKRRMGAND